MTRFLKMLVLLVLAALSLCAQTAQAVSIDADSAADLPGKWYRADGSPPPARAADLPAWLSQRHAVERVSQLGGSYWFYAELSNESDNRQWVLEPGNRVVEKIDASVYSQGQPVQRFKSGYLQDRDYMLHYGKAINLLPGANAALLIRFDSVYYPSMPKVRLYSQTAYRHLTLLENTAILAALGALMALMLYNFFIYLVTRESALFFYAAYLFDYFLGWAFTFQLPAELFGWHDLHLHYIWFFLLPVLGTLFYTRFLELPANFPRLAVISRINIVLPLLLLPSCFFALPFAHLLATLVISVWIVIALVCGMARLSSGYRPARYFVAAFVALLLPGCIILPANFGLLPELVRNSELLTLLGGTLDGILLAFALADKIRLFSEEKAQARQQIITQEEINKVLESNLQERNRQNAMLATVNRELQTAQMDLRVSQIRLQTILDNSPVGIWLVGVDGKYHFVNRTFCQAVGKTEGEFLAANSLDEVIGIDAAACLQSDRECLDKGGMHQTHEMLTFVDGKRHLMEVTKVKLQGNEGETEGIIGIAIDITERMRAENELKILNEQLTHEIAKRTSDLSALAAHIQNIAETERATMARELHDELGNTLVGLHMEVARLKREISAPDLLQELTPISEMLANASRITRGVVNRLYPTILDNDGFVAAVESLVEGYRKYSAMAVDLLLPEHIHLDPSHALAAYRITQECLTNIAKHSGADRVRIEAKADEDFLQMTICDNGKGLSVDKNNGGHGIFGMVERARYLGGSLAICSAEGQGTTARLVLPLPCSKVKTKKRVLVVDDHSLVRDAIRRLVEEQTDDFSVEGEAADGKTALHMAISREWDLMLLDITLPLKNGMKVLEEVAALKPDLPIIMLSSHAADEFAERAREKGAADYIEKSETETLVAAMRRATFAA